MDSESSLLPVFSADYRLDKKTASDAFTKRYFEIHKAKTRAQSVIFAVLAVWFALSLVIEFNNMTVFLFAVSILGFAAVLFMPKLQANSLCAKYENGVDFKIEIFGDSFKIISGESRFEFGFDKIIFLRQNDSFIYFELYEKLFPVPRSAFHEQLPAVLEHLKSALGERVLEQKDNKK